MLEKYFHFISQSLPMAHLLQKNPWNSWQTDSRHGNTTHAEEENLARFLTHLWPLEGSDRCQSTSGLQQETRSLWHLLFLQAKAKGLCWETVQLLLCTGLPVHLEFPVIFLAALLKLPGKLLRLKMSSGTPGVSALVRMWIDYPCCWNTSTVGKSTVNYICYST